MICNTDAVILFLLSHRRGLMITYKAAQCIYMLFSSQLSTIFVDSTNYLAVRASSRCLPLWVIFYFNFRNYFICYVLLLLKECVFGAYLYQIINAYSCWWGRVTSKLIIELNNHRINQLLRKCWVKTFDKLNKSSYWTQLTLKIDLYKSLSNYQHM